jgi:hypothetical protein
LISCFPVSCTCMPTLRCVILPPLKLELRLSQVCHNSPLTLNTNHTKAPELELKPNYYKRSGAILILISMLELDPRSGSSYTQGQDQGSVPTQFQNLLFSTWVSFHPVPELVILNLSHIPPSSRTCHSQLESHSTHFQNLSFSTWVSFHPFRQRFLPKNPGTGNPTLFFLSMICGSKVLLMASGSLVFSRSKQPLVQRFLKSFKELLGSHKRTNSLGFRVPFKIKKQITLEFSFLPLPNRQSWKERHLSTWPREQIRNKLVSYCWDPLGPKRHYL